MKSQISNLAFQKGFTLLEVVVAMAIVGLGVMTLLEIFSLGLRLGARSSERSEAISYGRQAIDGVLIRQRIQEGREEGSFGEGHRWRLQVQPFQGEDRLGSTGWELKEINLQMQYREGGREQQLELKTLRLVKKQGQ